MSLAYNGWVQGYVPRYHRVYLVDDHDIVRRGLLDLLVRARDIEVVGDSNSVGGAAEEILRLEADVMLLDLHLADGTGVEVCRAVRSVDPAVSGLLLTAAGNEEAAAAAVLAGAAGCLVKMNRDSDIVGTIRKQQPGRSQLDAQTIQRASDSLVSIMEALVPPATDQERRILEHIVAGLTDREIEAAASGSGDRIDASDVVAFVARMTGALVAAGGSSGQSGSGRHRRSD